MFCFALPLHFYVLECFTAMLWFLPLNCRGELVTLPPLVLIPVPCLSLQFDNHFPLNLMPHLRELSDP